MDEQYDSDAKSTPDNETAAPPGPIWLREQYLTEEPDLVPTDSEVSTIKKEVDPLAFLDYKKDWYILVNSTDGTKISYEKKEIKTRLRTNILAGLHDKNSPAIIFTRRVPFFPIKLHMRDLEIKWDQKAVNLAEFVKKHFALGVLYHPIWSYARAGLKWGAVAGILLKSLDSSIAYYETDPFMAVMLTMGIVLFLVPKYGKLFFVIFLFNISQHRGTGILLPMIIGVAILGAGLGCLPGMAVGGLIGWGRRRSMPHAHDAVSEPGNVIVKFVLLPFLAGIAVIFGYLFVITQILVPWLYNIREMLLMQQ